MKCPKCGDKDAKEIPLFRFSSYLCPNQSCSLFDVDRAMFIVASAFGVDEDEWELADEMHFLPGDLGMTD